MNSFSQFKLPAALERALQDLKFQTPTPIQEKAIPPGLDGKDIIGCAQTGTGKTAAFCIPIAIRLMSDLNKTALVLAPTRELALQIDAFWKGLTRHLPMVGSACLIGGASFHMQNRALSKRPRLIIATPGRLLDHIRQRTVSLSRTEFLVLDEADRMLDMGFERQLTEIMSFIPKKRQTLLFSATWDAKLEKLAKNYLIAPLRISVGAVSQAAPSVDQKLISTTVAKKNERLLDELNVRAGSVLVFARTQVRTDRVAKYLNSYGLDVGRIHGGRSQGQRNSALDAFKKGVTRILVATDVASRGIDVASIAHVINYDLPQTPEDYIHRIGRTGRAGLKGEAVSLLTPEDRSMWFEISKLLKKTGSSVPVLKS